MRLTDRQASVIRESVAKNFGQAARVWLFGSRVDEHRKGGVVKHSKRTCPFSGWLARQEFDWHE